MSKLKKIEKIIMKARKDREAVPKDEKKDGFIVTVPMPKSTFEIATIHAQAVIKIYEILLTDDESE